MKNVDWPLAIELTLVFVAMSYVRWRWFRARAMRGRTAPPKKQP